MSAPSWSDRLPWGWLAPVTLSLFVLGLLVYDCRSRPAPPRPAETTVETTAATAASVEPPDIRIVCTRRENKRVKCELCADWRGDGGCVRHDKMVEDIEGFCVEWKQQR